MSKNCKCRFITSGIIIILMFFYTNNLVECSNIEDARLLYNNAIKLKEGGKLDEAAKEYEKAIRKDRSILAEDDKGLIDILIKYHEKRLEQEPNNIKSLESLGFLYAVCYSDYSKAIQFYEKLLSRISDKTAIERTKFLIDRLRILSETSTKVEQENIQAMREERVKGWAELEKQEKLNRELERKYADAAILVDLTKQKEELEARIPQLEDELKSLQEEYKKANRLWHTLGDDRYDRKRDRLRKEIEYKEQELQNLKSNLLNLESKIKLINTSNDIQNNKKLSKEQTDDSLTEYIQENTQDNERNDTQNNSSEILQTKTTDDLIGSNSNVLENSTIQQATELNNSSNSVVISNE